MQMIFQNKSKHLYGLQNLKDKINIYFMFMIKKVINEKICGRLALELER